MERCLGIVRFLRLQLYLGRHRVQVPSIRQAVDVVFLEDYPASIYPHFHISIPIPLSHYSLYEIFCTNTPNLAAAYSRNVCFMTVGPHTLVPFLNVSILYVHE